MPWSSILKLRSPNQNTSLDRDRDKGGRKDSKRKQSKNVKKNKKIKAFTLKKINMEILDKYTN